MNIARNANIKKELIARWTQLGLKDSHVIKDANERVPELKISAAPFSRWKAGKVEASGKMLHISDDQCLWLCFRYGIWVNLNLGTPVLEDGRLKYVIEPYDEKEALRKLKIVFPNYGKVVSATVVKKYKKKK